MRRLKQTLMDTIHLLAVVAVISMLIALVIARQEPAWADFTVESAAVLGGSAVLARVINWSSRR